jgi:ketosteroid isomerase-like protein
MKYLIAGLTWLFPALARGMIGSEPVASEENDEAVVTRILTDYYRAFSTLDVQAILPYWLAPSLLVSPQGVAAMPTHAALAATIAPGMEAFRARGYARSELTMLHVKCLSAGTALAAGVAVRYKTDSQELDRVGVIYLLQKVDGSWKIVVIVVHDADNRLRIE